MDVAGIGSASDKIKKTYATFQRKVISKAKKDSILYLRLLTCTWLTCT